MPRPAGAASLDGPRLGCDPETLQDSLLARLDRLAPAKEVAQIGAAIGREFSYRLLAAVAPLPERPACPRRCDELVGGGADLRPWRAARRHATPSSTPSSRTRPIPPCSRADAANCTPGLPRCLESEFPEPGRDPARAGGAPCRRGRSLNEKAIDYWRKAGELSVGAGRDEGGGGAARQGSEPAREACRRASARDSEGTRPVARPRHALSRPLKGSVSADCGRTYARARALAERSRSRRAADPCASRASSISITGGPSSIEPASRQPSCFAPVGSYGQITDVITAYDVWSLGSRSLLGISRQRAAPVRRGTDRRREIWRQRSCRSRGRGRQAILIHLRSGSGGAWLSGTRQAIAATRLSTRFGRCNHDYSLVVTVGQRVQRRSGLPATPAAAGARRGDDLGCFRTRHFRPGWRAGGSIGVGSSPMHPASIERGCRPCAPAWPNCCRIGAKSDMSCYV